MVIGRRQFISAIGGAAVTWPLAAHAQQPGPMRRIGVLMNFPENDAEGRARLTAFAQALEKLGWTEGANVRLEIRWAADDPDLYRRYAEQLVALEPDLILASASPSVSALRRATRNVPIVFANVIDPVGEGLVVSLARPGGNITGFTAFEYSISGKWIDLLRTIAPRITRVAVVRDPTVISSIGQFAAIQTTASSSGLELSAIDPRDTGGIERAFATFASEPNGGVIVTASVSAVTHRDLIISLTARHRLPNVYSFRYYVLSGGLVSYGPDTVEEFKRAAGYVDRILQGAKPSDLPVQAPTKYELVINLKSAKAMGLDIPSALLATADEVIE